VTGSSIELIDSGEAIAQWLKQDFQQGRLLANTSTEARRIEIMTTDHSAHFTEVAHRILKPVKADGFKVVDL